MSEHIDTVIIGAGQAGLVISYMLREAGREHVLLERNRVAYRWHRERWDSLKFQFPSSSLRMPGYAYAGAEPDGFASKEAVAHFIEQYAEVIRAPVRCGVDVRSLSQATASSAFILQTNTGEVRANRVVIATGPFQDAALPRDAAALSSNVLQIHAKDYTRPDQLPAGAVVVVGAGSSGCQIAEELNESGRRVYLSVGAHKRAPRRYRGKDLVFWLDVLGRFDTPIDSLPGRRIPCPLLLTGAHGGHDMDLRRLAEQGVMLVGRFNQASGSQLSFANDVEGQLALADESFVEFIDRAEDYAKTLGMDTTDIEADLAFPKRPTRREWPTIVDTARENVT